MIRLVTYSEVYLVLASLQIMDLVAILPSRYPIGISIENHLGDREYVIPLPFRILRSRFVPCHGKFGGGTPPAHKTFFLERRVPLEDSEWLLRCHNTAMDRWIIF
jgi:hypothetical protein